MGGGRQGRTCDGWILGKEKPSPPPVDAWFITSLLGLSIISVWFLTLTRYFFFQSLEEELNRRQTDIRQLTEAAGRLQEQQVLEYRALIGSLTLRWQELHRQFLVFQGRPEDSEEQEEEQQNRLIMGGPDFVSRVNKLREAIASVSRQLHSPPLTLKHYEQLSGQEDSVKVSLNQLPTQFEWTSVNLFIISADCQNGALYIERRCRCVQPTERWSRREGADSARAWQTDGRVDSTQSDIHWQTSLNLSVFVESLPGSIFNGISFLSSSLFYDW